MNKIFTLKLILDNYFGKENEKKIVNSQYNVLFRNVEYHIYLKSKYNKYYKLNCNVFDSKNIRIMKNKNVFLVKTNFKHGREGNNFITLELYDKNNIGNMYVENAIVINTYAKIIDKSISSPSIYQMGSFLINKSNINRDVFELKLYGDMYKGYTTGLIKVIHTSQTNFNINKEGNDIDYYRKEFAKLRKNNFEQIRMIKIGNGEKYYRCVEYNVLLDLTLPYSFFPLLLSYSVEDANSVEYYDNILRIASLSYSGNEDDGKYDVFVRFLTLFENMCDYCDDFVFDYKSKNELNLIELFTDIRKTFCGDCEDLALNVIKNIHDLKFVHNNRFAKFNSYLENYVVCFTQAIVSTCERQQKKDYVLHTFVSLISKYVFKKWMNNSCIFFSRKDSLRNDIIDNMECLRKCETLKNKYTRVTPILVCEGVEYFGAVHSYSCDKFEHLCFVKYLLSIILMQYMYKMCYCVELNNIKFKKEPKFDSLIKREKKNELYKLCKYDNYLECVELFLKSGDMAEYSSFYKKIVSIDVIDVFAERVKSKTTQYIVSNPHNVENVGKDTINLKEDLMFSDFVHNFDDNILIPTQKWSDSEIEIVKNYYLEYDEKTTSFSYNVSKKTKIPNIEIFNPNNSENNKKEEEIELFFYVKNHKVMEKLKASLSNLIEYFANFNTFDSYFHIFIKLLHINVTYEESNTNDDDKCKLKIYVIRFLLQYNIK